MSFHRCSAVRFNVSSCCWALLCRATLSAAIGGGGERPEENTRKSSLIVPLGPSSPRSPPSVAQWPTVDSALGQDLDSERERGRKEEEEGRGRLLARPFPPLNPPFCGSIVLLFFLPSEEAFRKLSTTKWGWGMSLNRLERRVHGESRVAK